MPSIGLLLVCLVGGWLVYRYRDRANLRGITLAGERVRVGQEEWSGDDVKVLSVIPGDEGAVTLVCRVPDGRFLRGVRLSATRDWRFYLMSDEAALEAVRGSVRSR
ncbi:hypothetical protein FHW69_000590 [Luteibacter sp. Sphag1AF]|uniref:hypothetical protein n=1 Tax=Luteibacter sp. Sphag1AF TaxID=2587031 RepID=UPI00160B79BD|nr:hypothetical protein [Luteibacter sp. Sphag1AF]MBB3226000.1 hypothetical protein [Luteibacter sp. Sphag1AF]